jgi:hypothetical protein
MPSEKQIEEVRHLASWAEHDDMTLAFRVVPIPATAAHFYSAPFAPNRVQRTFIYQRVRDKSAPFG